MSATPSSRLAFGVGIDNLFLFFTRILMNTWQPKSTTNILVVLYYKIVITYLHSKSITIFTLIALNFGNYNYQSESNYKNDGYENNYHKLWNWSLL